VTAPLDESDERFARLDSATRWIGRRAVITLRGDIDMATAAQFKAAMDGAVGSGALEVWVDLTEIDFMDSTGLHALVALRSRANELSLGLTVICPEGPARRTIRIGGLESALPLCENRTEAQFDR
jgi:anti-sigma B factor antagonist